MTFVESLKAPDFGNYTERPRKRGKSSRIAIIRDEPKETQSGLGWKGLDFNFFSHSVNRQVCQSPMHLHHGKGIALAIREERGPQMIDLLRNREVAGCEPQERGGCRATVGNTLKVGIAETGTEGLGNGFDGVAKAEFGKVDGASHDWQQVHQPGDQGAERLAEIGKFPSQLFQPRFFVGGIGENWTIEGCEGLDQGFCKSAPWIAASLREKFPVVQYA